MESGWDRDNEELGAGVVLEPNSTTTRLPSTFDGSKFVRRNICRRGWSAGIEDERREKRERREDTSDDEDVSLGAIDLGE